jgi:hypothetical protein
MSFKVRVKKNADFIVILTLTTEPILDFQVIFC